MDYQMEFQSIFHSTGIDLEDNLVYLSELIDKVPDTRQRFKETSKILSENFKRSNKIISNQLEEINRLNETNYQLTEKLIYLNQRVKELEKEKSSTNIYQNQYESLEKIESTPETIRNLNDENSDSDIVLKLNNQAYSKPICKSVSSPAIMFNAKNREETRFKKEFRIFNTKVSISHAKRLHKENHISQFPNENEKKTLDRLDTRPSLINLFKKPKKEHREKAKRLSSSMNDNLRVFDKET